MNHKIIRSKRKTVSLQVKEDASVVVRVPKHLPEHYIIAIIEQKKAWISRKQLQAKARKERLKDIDFGKVSQGEALRKISERVNYYSVLSGLGYSRIRISNAQKCWGSCSSKGNLNFAKRLALAPLVVIDYVVVHELVHLRHRNHSKRFWQDVAQLFPEYIQAKKWLKEYGGGLS